MKETLNNKIFKMLTALIIATTLILLFVVWNSASKTIYQNLAKQLDLSEAVIVREIINRKKNLIINTRAIYDGVSFRSTLALQNSNNIKPALDTYLTRIGAAFVSIVDKDANIISQSGALATSISTLTYKKYINLVLQDGDSTSLILLNDTLVWILWLPIQATNGDIIAYAANGFTLNEGFLGGLKALVNLDITLFIDSDITNDTSLIVSTLTPQEQTRSYLEDSLLNDDSNFVFKLLRVSNKNSLFSQKFSLASMGGGNNELYVSANAEEIQEKFLNLQLSIGAISLVAIILTIFIGRILATQVTKPLEYITNYAVKISKGDYSNKVELSASSIELEQLLTAFKAMEDAVQQREASIAYQAQRDMLTRLFNRDYIKVVLDKKFASGAVFQAIGINILGFRGVNDVFGYQYGDICLQELAHRVTQLGGVSARLTGGEILWLPDSPVTLPQIAAIKTQLEAEIHTDSISLPMRTAIGVLNCPRDTDNSEDMFRRMNIVIDEAQLSRKLLLQFNTKLEEKYLRRFAIIDKLKNALLSNSQELSLHYQPKLNLKTNTVEHAEALVRWEDADLGFISPEEFISIAEHAGFINAVTQWVLTRAVRDVIAFRQQGLDLCIAVNISSQDLLSDKFMDFASDLLDKNQLDHKAISFELTEGVIVREPEKAIRHMQRMRDAGYHLAIDDFGTGYSSLSYLTNLPVNILKIDRCFVMPLATQSGEQAICRSVINLAKSFNMQVVAEGVEDETSLKMLADFGCDYAQGYFISRPLEDKHFVTWMLAHQQQHPTPPTSLLRKQ